MDDNQFWVSIWKMVAVSFCVMVLAIAGCTVNNTRVVNEMTSRGADPIAAACAVNGAGERAQAAMCALAASGKK